MGHVLDTYRRMSTDSLEGKRCFDFGQAPGLSAEEVEGLLAQLNSGWSVVQVDGCDRIRRDWKVQDFMTGLGFFGKIAEIAESGPPPRPPPGGIPRRHHRDVDPHHQRPFHQRLYRRLPHRQARRPSLSPTIVNNVASQK